MIWGYHHLGKHPYVNCKWFLRAFRSCFWWIEKGNPGNLWMSTFLLKPRIAELPGSHCKKHHVISRCLIQILYQFRWLVQEGFLFKRIHPWSLTWLPKSYLPKRKFIFQPSFFRGYVKLSGSKCQGLVKVTTIRIPPLNSRFCVHRKSMCLRLGVARAGNRRTFLDYQIFVVTIF